MYNMHTKRKERCVFLLCLQKATYAHTAFLSSQTPLFDDVRDIVISKRMPVVLVSFEEVTSIVTFLHPNASDIIHSAFFQAAPQLWKLEIVRDRARTNGPSPPTARLNLKHAFALNVPTSIAGSCYFGGKDEQFVFCVGKGGVLAHFFFFLVLC